jgi:hypothetical protein
VCAELARGYLQQCREEAGRRLVRRCFTADGALDKHWAMFAPRRFLGKSLAPV